MNPNTARVRRILNRARYEAGQPGDRDPASGAGTVNEVSSLPDVSTREGESGEAIPPMMWNVDNWNAADWVKK